MTNSSMRNLRPCTLGQYQLLKVIARSDMSTIYKAYQPALDRYVAIKLMGCPEDPEAAARFRREARMTACLQHPNILPIYDYGEQDELIYLVLQYVERGLTLSQRADMRMPTGAALRLVYLLLDALNYAHRCGIVHRDVKPSNILLPAPHWPVLADFGIAKPINDGQRLTAAGLAIGTPAYMAPEQVHGQPVDARTDLYATGVVLYELLTGCVPFDADTPAAVFAQVAHELPMPPRSLNPSIPPEVEAIVLRALAKDPAARYQSAAEMAQALKLVVPAHPHIPARSPVATDEQEQSGREYKAALSQVAPSAGAPYQNGTAPRAGVQRAPIAKASAPITARRAWQPTPRRGPALGLTFARMATLVLALLLFFMLNIATSLDSATRHAPEVTVSRDVPAAISVTAGPASPVRRAAP